MSAILIYKYHHRAEYIEEEGCCEDRSTQI